MTAPNHPASDDERAPGHPAEADTAVSAGEALSGRESRPAGKVQTEDVEPHEAAETDVREPGTPQPDTPQPDTPQPDSRPHQPER